MSLSTFENVLNIVEYYKESGGKDGKKKPLRQKTINPSSQKSLIGGGNGSMLSARKTIEVLKLGPELVRTPSKQFERTSNRKKPSMILASATSPSHQSTSPPHPLMNTEKRGSHEFSPRSLDQDNPAKLALKKGLAMRSQFFKDLPHQSTSSSSLPQPPSLLHIDQQPN